MNLSGRTSLHHAIKNGFGSVVRTLVKLGADIHAKDNKYPKGHFYVFHELTIIMNLRGGTILHYASFKGHDSVVRALVQLGADINAKNEK